MNDFIILSSQRSGSTFLLSLLSSHNRTDTYGELFQSFGRNHQSSDDFLNSYTHFRTKYILNRIISILARRQLINKFLNGIYKDKGHSKSTGFKLMYNHIEWYPEILEYIFKNNIRIIHLIRGNTLKKYISLLIANKTNIFVSRNPVETKRITVPVDNLISDLRDEEDTVESFRLRLKDYPLCLEVNYEDLTKDLESVSGKILEFLELDTEQKLSAKPVKLNPDTLEKIIENYDQVRNILKNTKFETYLHN